MGESISHRKPEEGQLKKVATYTSFKSNEEMAQEAAAAGRRKPAAGVDNREAKLAGVPLKDDERALEYQNFLEGNGGLRPVTNAKLNIKQIKSADVLGQKPDNRHVSDSDIELFSNDFDEKID